MLHLEARDGQMSTFDECDVTGDLTCKFNVCEWR